MEAVFGLLLLLLRVSHGEESDCDGRLDGAHCYGILGGTMILRLMDSAFEIPKYEWIKGNLVILKWSDNKIISNIIESRSLFIPRTGTFRINNLNRNDSGQYILMIFDSEGRLTGKKTLQLSLKEKTNRMIVLSSILSVLFVFLIVGAAVIFIQKKTRCHKAEKYCEQEVTYADVRVVQSQERQMKRMTEEEVEYCQVKFSAQPK